jgi:hypothetical protein
MSVYKINDIFSKSELEILHSLTNSIVIPIKEDGSYVYDTENSNSLCTISKSLGRVQATGFAKGFEHIFYEKILEIIKPFTTKDVTLSNVTYVEYNSKYGTPVLPPHFDGDSSDIIVNFQLSSNTVWALGVDLALYELEDNSAMIFNPNKNIHWRPSKEFKDKEYVKLIFFRFQSIDGVIDNSHLRYSLDHEIYKEVNDFRDSL